MSLHVDFGVQRGDFRLEVALDAPAGEVTAVIGPNGAGKSTLLACIAGSLPIDSGVVALGGLTLDCPPHTLVPQERRRLGTVAQEYLLFPHLSALDNVAFGVRCSGRGRRQARLLAQPWLDRVDVGQCAALKPASLSGGQAQRVALARALAIEPQALLLDEPLAALDTLTRVRIRADLRRYLAEFEGPVLLVTHDAVDALTLADRVAVLDGGGVVQAGTLAEVTGRPTSRFVADLLGTNLLRGEARGTIVELTGGSSLTVAEPQRGPVFLTVAPSAVSLHRAEPEGSARNRWPVRVAGLETLGDRVRVHLAGGPSLVAEVTPAAAADLELAEGAQRWAGLKATEITCYPA
ncbi:MAG: ABC transporter ATP-binding protein [Microthrixaceae bacterium]